MSPRKSNHGTLRLVEDQDSDTFDHGCRTEVVHGELPDLSVHAWTLEGYDGRDSGYTHADRCQEPCHHGIDHESSDPEGDGAHDQPAAT